MIRLRLLLILALIALVSPCEFGANSVMAQGRKRRPQAQKRELDVLLTDVISYLKKQPLERAAEPGNFFGKVVLRPPSEDAVDELPPEPGQFGFYVLGGLQGTQIRQLSDLARQQLTAVAECEAKQREAFAMIMELQKQARRDRAMERELQTLGREIGNMEAAMGLVQAEVFLAVNEGMTPDQREYLALLRRAPDSGSLKNPSVAKIYEQASRLDPKLRLMVLKMAERCCMYLTGTGDRNVPTLQSRLRTDPDSDEAEQKMGLLTALNPAQMKGLTNVMTAQTRMKQDAQTRRVQVALMFDGLKAKKHVDDRRLAAPSSAMGEADMGLLAARFQSLAGFADSLSNAQRIFIQNNILAP